MTDTYTPATEEQGDLLARVMDTLAYYQCRETNPKADHPRMGYHAFSEDQREHLQESKREAAEEIVRMMSAHDAEVAAKAWDEAIRYIAPDDVEIIWAANPYRKAVQS